MPNPSTPQHHNTTTPQHHNTTTPQHHNNVQTIIIINTTTPQKRPTIIIDKNDNTAFLPSFLFAAPAGGRKKMANNHGMTTGVEGVLSRRLDGSDAAAAAAATASIGKLKKGRGQNIVDGNYDVDGVVHVEKVGLKFGRNAVVWGGNNCSEFFSFLFFFSFFLSFLLT